MAETDCASESASSVCDEERVRRLFQACDANNDGYIDSQDLLAICRELSLEDSLDELMLQLGADAQGRISYEQFLRRRLALRPEIDALKRNGSEADSQGKLDSWEWDSGARDMSPVPKKPPAKENSAKERIQLQLNEQAQRYEEQLTELHSVIAELTRKLHQQRTMAIAEEDEVSESCASAHEDSVTCPLEVSELEPLEAEQLSDIDNKILLSDSPLELPEPKLPPSQSGATSPSDPLLRQEVLLLRRQLHEATAQLESLHRRTPLSPDSHLSDSDHKYTNIAPVHRALRDSGRGAHVTRVAERVRLRRAADAPPARAHHLADAGELPTAVAEHIVGDILRQCDAANERQAMDVELKRTAAKLEHARSQNSVLAITLTETKAHCDRLALLCGKYESNAIALRLALGVTDRAIEAYDVLLALLETELSIDDNNSNSIENRTAAETVAKQLLTHLDTYQTTDVLLSPWQNHVYSTPIPENEENWSADHETKLREHVSRLKAERSSIEGTYVALESTQIEPQAHRPASSQEARKMDLEMAVLIQELMSLREDKTELATKLFVVEKEKSAIEVKLKYVDGQQKAQSAALKNLQGQLKDTEALLALATQNRDRGYSDAEHAQGVEFELMQALAREARLKVRLQELVGTLEQVTKNAEARLLEGRDIVHDLNATNSILAETVDRNTKKYQAKFKKMEHQMLAMAEKHGAQVLNLQQKVAALETPPTHSSADSINSVTV